MSQVDKRLITSRASCGANQMMTSAGASLKKAAQMQTSPAAPQHDGEKV